MKGRFDSEFMDADMDELVASLKARGLRKVKGKLYGDVSFSDSLFYGEGWCWDDAPYDFQPMLSPLMFHKGCVDVSVVPYKKGVNHVTVVPRSSFYTVENLTTNSETGKFSVGRDWMNGKNDLVIQGGSLNALNEKMTISRPADFFMHTFRERAHDQRQKRCLDDSRDLQRPRKACTLHAQSILDKPDGNFGRRHLVKRIHNRQRR